jgi:hypothetical protein
VREGFAGMAIPGQVFPITINDAARGQALIRALRQDSKWAGFIITVHLVSIRHDVTPTTNCNPSWRKDGGHEIHEAFPNFKKQPGTVPVNLSIARWSTVPRSFESVG